MLKPHVCRACKKEFIAHKAKWCEDCRNTARWPSADAINKNYGSQHDTWTPSAIHCLETMKSCQRCDSGLSVDFSQHGGCKMPIRVEYLLKKIGPPAADIKPREGLKYYADASV